MHVMIFGGSGGLGKRLTANLSEHYDVITSLSSQDVDISIDGEVESVFKNFSPDVVINLATLNYNSLLHKTNVDYSEHQVNVNIIGTLNLIRHAVPKMREGKFGRLIFMSSILSQKPVVGAGVYSASKAFVDNLVKTCAMENAKYGITCNSIVLGYSEGGLTEKIPKDHLENIVDSIPMKRLCRNQEILSAVNFLIENEYVTGTNLVMAGGVA